MAKNSAVALSVSLLLLVLPPAGRGEDGAKMPRLASPSNCVQCHARTGKAGVVYAEYIRWASSAHATGNVACEACHGGDASTPDKDKAHAGMLLAGAADSPINPKNVPKTCGRCHELEYQHYVQSEHYKQLEGNGRGANCVTCHGSTAVTVPTAATVARTCEICHNPDKEINPAIPARAFRALVRLTEARGQVALTEAAVLVAKEHKKDTTVLDRGLARSRESISRAVEEWHTFNLPVVEKATTDAYDFASQTRVQAEQGAMAPVLMQGRNNFWPVILFVLLAASVMLNLLILLRLSRRQSH